MTLDGSEFVDKAYARVLGRSADPTGLATYRAWLNGSAASKIKVLQALRKSGEGQARKTENRWVGLAIWWNKRSYYDIRFSDMLRYDDAEFVATAYGRLLGREPDSSGYAGRLEQARQGTRGRARALVELCMSPEGRAVHAHVQGLGFATLRWDFRFWAIAILRRALPWLSGPRVDLRALLQRDGLDFIEAAYIKALGRRAGRGDQHGIAIYAGWLNGTTAAKIKVLQSLLRSDEGRTKLRSLLLALTIWWNRRSIYDIRLRDILQHDDAELIANAYRLLLGREPDSAAYALRAVQVQAGRAGRVRMLAELCASSEGRMLHANVQGLTLAVFRSNFRYGVASLIRRFLPWPTAPRIKLRALLQLEGPEFVEMAYVKALGRRTNRADGQGMAIYSAWLNGGNAAKIRVLQSLRRSEEGRTMLRRLTLAAAIRWRRRSIYDIKLNDMLLLDDEEFVAAAYKLLLGRAPDPVAAALRVTQSQTGRHGRLVMLAELCASSEGRMLYATVRGLRFAVLKENLYHGAAAIARRLLPPRIRRAVAARRRSDALQPRRFEV